MKPEGIEGLFRELKAKVEAGTISEDEFEAQLREFLFQDDSGTYWTVGAQTENWYRHENGDWVRASPPPSLKPAAGMDQELGVETPAVPPGRRGGLDRRVVLGVLGLLFGAFLVVAGVLYYQLGRTPSTTVPAADSPAATTNVTSTPVLEPTATTTSPAATALPTEEASLTPRVTATQAIPTSTPRPTSTPTPSVSPTWAIKYGSPLLLAPEEGSQFGRGYDAVLQWRLVDELAEGEYYHVEVCWNGCKNPDEFHGHYLRETSYVFPRRIYGGRAIDDKYHWHVTVRAQQGDQPEVPGDPAISEPSETRVFILTE